MNEAEWMLSVSRRLRTGSLAGANVEISCRRRLPYRFEIRSYDADGQANSHETTSYEIDLLVSEVDSRTGHWTPRVAIEGKLGAVTTHDALTYSAKAATHVQVHPYLRYGILIGGIASVPLRLFRHGAHFDFMLTWSGDNPDQNEWELFDQIVREEIEASRQLQKLIESNRTRLKDRYAVVRHKLVLSPKAAI